MFTTHRRKKHSRLRKDGIHATNQPLTVGKGFANLFLIFYNVCSIE